MLRNTYRACGECGVLYISITPRSTLSRILNYLLVSRLIWFIVFNGHFKRNCFLFYFIRFSGKVSLNIHGILVSGYNSTNNNVELFFLFRFENSIL